MLCVSGVFSSGLVSLLVPIPNFGTVSLSESRDVSD